MCGRFALSVTPARMERLYGVRPPEGYRARWNVAPDTGILAVRIAGGRDVREAVMLRWGIVGPWMKDPKDPARQINARSEGVAEKPMFRDAFRKRRCVIPADGFYEWRKVPTGPSVPYFVRRRDGEPLSLAGLWQPMRLESGEVLETCAIVTTAAHPALRPLHHRMAVMLRDDVLDAWMDPGLRDPSLAHALLENPLPEDALESYVVGRAVSNVRNEGPGLVEPAGEEPPPREPPPPAQASLF